jgi:hypothetical protein
MHRRAFSLQCDTQTTTAFKAQQPSSADFRGCSKMDLMEQQNFTKPRFTF